MPSAARASILRSGCSATLLREGRVCRLLVGQTSIAMPFSAILVRRASSFAAATPWLVAEGIVVAIAMADTETLKIFAAISLGHLAKKHRVLWAVLAYVGIDLALNILFGAGVSSGLLVRILGSGSWGFFADSGEITAHGLGMMAGAMGSVLLWEILLGTGFFFLSRFILKKHLNLE